MNNSGKPSGDILSGNTIGELARFQGHAEIEAQSAARIAVGAANAIRAVRASLPETLFDTEPMEFLAELHRLAAPFE